MLTYFNFQFQYLIGNKKKKSNKKDFEDVLKLKWKK